MKILCKEDAQEAIEEISRWLAERYGGTDDCRSDELARKWAREILHAGDCENSGCMLCES